MMCFLFQNLVGGHDSPFPKSHFFAIPKRSRSQTCQVAVIRLKSMGDQPLQKDTSPMASYRSFGSAEFFHMFTLECPPAQDSSHHQDYYSFRSGSQPKPSFDPAFWEGGPQAPRFTFRRFITSKFNQRPSRGDIYNGLPSWCFSEPTHL